MRRTTSVPWRDPVSWPRCSSRVFTPRMKTCSLSEPAPLIVCSCAAFLMCFLSHHKTTETRHSDSIRQLQLPNLHNSQQSSNYTGALQYCIVFCVSYSDHYSFLRSLVWIRSVPAYYLSLFRWRSVNLVLMFIDLLVHQILRLRIKKYIYIKQSWFSAKLIKCCLALCHFISLLLNWQSRYSL